MRPVSSKELSLTLGGRLLKIQVEGRSRATMTVEGSSTNAENPPSPRVAAVTALAPRTKLRTLALFPRAATNLTREITVRPPGTMMMRVCRATRYCTAKAIFSATMERVIWGVTITM
jgi:hypothetical protein